MATASSPSTPSTYNQLHTVARLLGTGFEVRAIQPVGDAVLHHRALDAASLGAEADAPLQGAQFGLDALVALVVAVVVQTVALLERPRVDVVGRVVAVDHANTARARSESVVVHVEAIVMIGARTHANAKLARLVADETISTINVRQTASTLVGHAALLVTA